MKTNEDLQRDVERAISWEPQLSSAEIGVIVKDGVVTLTGTVDNYSKKLEAEDAAKNVNGVKVVVEKILVRFNGTSMAGREDTEIAIDIVNALKGKWQVPHDKVKVMVEDGWVSLEGVLHWNFEREAVEKAITHLAGVKGISNEITIQSTIDNEIRREEVEAALARNGSIDDVDILVHAFGRTVTLRGTVTSLFQKNEAGRTAWKTPGVWIVDNALVVEPED